MNIYFQAKNVEIQDDFKQFMAERMYGLNKFFSPHANAYVDMEKTHNSHNGNDLYYLSIKIDDPIQLYFVEEYRENLRKAFDHAYENSFRVVRNERKKTRSLARRASASLKRLFKKGK